MGECGSCTLSPSSDALMKIIKAQTNIAKIGPDLGNVMSEVVRTAQELTQSNGATIELAEGEEMIYRAVSGSLEPFLGFKLSREGSLSGLCVETGNILYSEDTASDKRVDRNAAAKVSAASMVVVPLRFHDANVGVLKVISNKKHFFNDDAICILTMMAESMGAVMYHAGQYSVDELLKQATTDAMTGVENRASFYEKLRLKLICARERPIALGIAMIDMDGLKTINDTYGHRAGDEAIRELAKRLRSSVREHDVVARLGGDEFALILSSSDTNLGMEAILERFRKNMEEPFVFEGESLVFGASVGYVTYPDEADTLTALIDMADTRMYDDKRLRKSTRTDGIKIRD